MTLYTERRCSARHKGRYAHGGECAGGGLLYVGRCMLGMKVVVRIAREGQLAVRSVVRGVMVCVVELDRLQGDVVFLEPLRQLPHLRDLAGAWAVRHCPLTTHHLRVSRHRLPRPSRLSPCWILSRYSQPRVSCSGRAHMFPSAPMSSTA